MPLAAHRDTLGRALWQFSASGAVIAGRVEKIILANDQLAAFGANTTTPPTVGAIADAVWDEATSGHVAAGTFGEMLGYVDAEVWSYTTRTLTQTGASVTTAVTGTDITVYRGTRWEVSSTSTCWTW